MTQIHVGALRALGYTFHDRRPDLKLRGVKGPIEDGYSLIPDRLFFLQKMFSAPTIAAFDLCEWAEDGIDGLLGFDLIRNFQLEMDGPRGLLRVL